MGCGHISVTHLKAWEEAGGCRLAGVFDLDPDLAAKRARDFGPAQVHASVDELLAAVDVVDVCTPPQTHAAIATQVLEAGRHLVIEKPLVTALEEWEALSELARRSAGKIAVIHNLKYAHGIQQAKAWVEAGKIGEVIRLQREFLTDPGSDRMLVGDRHWSHRLPGGRWFETLPHELYLTHYFAGPLELESVVARQTGSGPSGAPADEVMITLAGPRSMATIHFSAHCKTNRRVFSVQGSEGRIEVDVLSDFAHLSRVGDSKSGRAFGRPLADAMGTLLGSLPNRLGYLRRRWAGQTPHASLIRAFARHLQGHGPEPTPFEEVDYVVRGSDRIGREIDRQLAIGKAG